MNGRNRAAVAQLQSWSQIACCSLALTIASQLGSWAGALLAQDPALEAQWIWTSAHPKDAVPAKAECHFRKTFALKEPTAAHLAIAADDEYELYINGRRIGIGESTKKLDEYDVTKSLVRGPNVIAVKVTNQTAGSAALVVRLTVQEKETGWKSFSSDTSWKTTLRPFPLWNTVLYSDRGWDGAVAFGPLGSTAPWDRREEVPVAETHRNERFDISPEFEVQQLLKGDEVGSLIACTFNEFGNLLCSKEGGPLLMVFDSDNDRQLDKSRVYCDKVKSCQGILALNGEVFVTADGPDGPALYRLADKDRNGTLEDVRTVLKLPTENSEHGGHGVVLGPDGLIYVMLGNHVKMEVAPDVGSPHRDYYEGDIVGPKYEDPTGHAAGVTAPGGVVVRTDPTGSGVQIVAGGLRNPYDLCFNREGEMFIHDADMESDEGLPWYRPTRLAHILPGGEYGWRSGWSKWPEYFVDSLPATLDTGKGSPTGIVAYNHFMFPLRYHGAIFTADWSKGTITAVKMQRNGATYKATPEVFLSGNPLNVTDLDVGPDGWLYFVTGGRGTAGGVYRVMWKGTVPEQISNVGTGLTAVIRQPQITSAFARQNIAALKKQMGDTWNPSLIGVAQSAANPVNYRLQALDLMQLYGPEPTPELLLQLSQEKNEIVRAKAAQLMGLHPSEDGHVRLIEMLDDSDRFVRRSACEALSRADQAPPVDKLLKMLASDDRFEAWSARRLLERMPVVAWKKRVLDGEGHRLLIQGGLALMIAHPSKEHGLEVLQKVQKHMQQFVSDGDFIDLLRLTQVALHQGEVPPEEVPALRTLLAEEFPSGEPTMNRELIRLLTAMQETSITPRYLEYLKSGVTDADKLHMAMHLRFVEAGWTAEQRLELLTFYEAANNKKGGGSYARYIIAATRDFAKTMSEQESRLVLAQGTDMPNAALGALYTLPEQIDDTTLQSLVDLDGRLADRQGDSFQRLKVGIVAVLSRSGDEASLAYLRKIWERDPDRRQAIAVGLSQKPDGDNWPYLVRSLPSLEPAAAREVLGKLATVPQAPEEPDPYRNVILLGLKMKEKGSEPAIELLQFWTGEELSADADTATKLASWQKWFTQTYPEMPDAVIPAAPDAKYTFDALLSYLNGEEAEKATATRGAEVFVKAQCAKCHRFGDRGESMGPDLTTVANRFTKRELLESIYYPSMVISSQYQAKTVQTTDGRTLTGLVAPGGGGETVILTQTGERISVPAGEIEETKPSKVSAMPAGLLETLTPEEIADLMAYMQRTGKSGIARRPLEKLNR
ncbi:Cytochrome c [Anatilimnocola aggregata]|uniref:Cytochrome c n=1 Tax=Anatilimnocola aggregata TaxID=2528021 RepID=A0A517Y524_9BACT|nr:HEAT repeat domain-containing protein [Anatilimnocola aggregata]QDU25222.1 Cytochrome c [Anatilimnocola aggregata]